MSKTYAITGANRGLGLEFVRQLMANSSNTIIAAVRSLDGEIADLKSYASKSSQIHILECDTSNLSSIESFAAAVTKTIGKDTQLDYLLNSAGINAVPEQTSLSLGASDIHQHIDINVIGPAKTVEALLPHLKKGSVIMNMTSGLGSCGKGVIKCATYSISKAALNMLTVHEAGDLKEKGIAVVCMDPGWVKTRMGGDGAILEPEQSIGGMLKVIHGLKESDSGKFYQYDGKEVPW